MPAPLPCGTTRRASWARTTSGSSRTAALRDLPLERLEGELALYGHKVVYTVSIDSPNSDDQIRALIDQVRGRAGSLSTRAGGRRVEFTLRHNGETIMENVYGG